MASVDVPVALLGYGTVGAAVNRLLRESADDIERATGHRLRVVRALVRDPAKERAFAPEPGVLTTDFAEIRDDPSIALVAEVMGGIEPARGLRARPARRRQAGRLREQAARRAARRRALRGRLRGRGPAPLRGVRVRGDPGDQGAARGARRRERPPRARDRERHDELHPHEDGGRRRLRGGARRGAAARLRGGRSRPTTSAAPTRPRRWRSSPRSRSARACRSTTSPTPGSTPSRRSTSPRRGSSRWSSASSARRR